MTAMFKGLAVLGTISLAGMFAGVEDVKSIGEVAIMVAGMVAIAAVMRTDVKDLKDWKIAHDKEVDEYKQSHNAAHTQIATALTNLTTLMTENQRRISNLESDMHHRRTNL